MSDIYHVQLESGQLEISVNNSCMPLDNLLTFASRENPKRYYLFVSKILGKYVPCLPSEMRNSYHKLASKVLNNLNKNSAIWVLGVAETATGLGAGVAQELHKLTKAKTIFSHTTRCQVPSNLAFTVNEDHSHAPSHLIYELMDTAAENITTLVLVDDEISTGNTLDQITQELIKKLPYLTTVVWVSLVNWLPEERKDQLTQSYSGIDIFFESLLDGTYNFVENKQFNVNLPDHTVSGITTIDCRADIGRTGYVVGTEADSIFCTESGLPFDFHLLDRKLDYIVIGTGEFTHQPFLFAEKLERNGFSVLFQSTGRSPVLRGGGIERKESFFEPTQNGFLYLYNLPRGHQAIILYETKAQYLSCPLRNQIGAIVGILA